MTRKSDVLYLEESPAALNGLHGYRPRPRTRRISAAPEFWPAEMEAICAMWPDEGAAPFWADIRANLTFDEIESIPNRFSEQWDVIAPWVTAWNAEAWDQMSKSWQPVPPPSEAGPDAFKTQPRQVSEFIVACLKNPGLANDLPKESKPSSDTGDG